MDQEVLALGDFRLAKYLIMGKKPAPPMKAPKEPPQKKQKDAATAAAAKAAPKAAAKQQVIADDCTPDEMKASIQRMLAFCKYRADANKNKSGQGMAEAQEVLEASGLNELLIFHAVNIFMLNHEAYRKIGDSDRRGFIQAYQKFNLKDLKWMGSHTKKAISSETEVDASLKGMMTMCLV